MTFSGPRPGSDPENGAPAQASSPDQSLEDDDPRLSQAREMIQSRKDELREVEGRALQAGLQTELAREAADVRLSTAVVRAQHRAEDVITRAGEHAARQVAQAEASLIAVRAQCRRFVRRVHDVVASTMDAQDDDDEVARALPRPRLLTRLEELQHDLGDGSDEEPDDGVDGDDVARLPEWDWLEAASPGEAPPDTAPPDAVPPDEAPPDLAPPGGEGTTVEEVSPLPRRAVVDPAEESLAFFELETRVPEETRLRRNWWGRRRDRTPDAEGFWT